MRVRALTLTLDLALTRTDLTLTRGEMEAERPHRSAGRVLHHLEDFLKVRARG